MPGKKAPIQLAFPVLLALVAVVLFCLGMISQGGSGALHGLTFVLPLAFLGLASLHEEGPVSFPDSVPSNRFFRTSSSPRSPPLA